MKRYSISELAAELNVSASRVRQLYRLIGIEPVLVDNKHFINEEQREKLLLYRGQVSD